MHLSQKFKSILPLNQQSMPIKPLILLSLDNNLIIIRLIRLILPVIQIGVFNLLKLNHIKVEHEISHLPKIKKLDIYIIYRDHLQVILVVLVEREHFAEKILKG